MSVDSVTQAAKGIGTSPVRPDAPAKVKGEFAFSSDLFAPNMAWGHVLRSPHPYARIRSIDIGPALAIPGVHSVITASDVPGRNAFGQDVVDQPVFADDVVRYVGEAVAAVAADHPATAQRAAEAILVDYEVLSPLLDPESAFDETPIHPDGNVFDRIVVRRGDATVRGDVIVEGTYEVGIQDQAFMGPESALAIPAEDGGVDLFISTQFLHIDRDQVAACLALPTEKVRLTLAGVGGAFGAREDITLQVHVCLLALTAGRPVKMVYSRRESFLGHVHRHPARMWYRHHASRDGDLLRVEARLLFDGGAYAATSALVLGNACTFAAGPYRVPSVLIDGAAVRTNNPPCGAMRGFGAVQVCFGHESQMDKLAQALDMDPMRLRARNALARGDQLVTGQVLTGATPVREVIETLASDVPPAREIDHPLSRPNASGRTSDPAALRRGVGYAVGFKNMMYSGGYDDYSTARVRWDDGQVTVTCAAAEVGQGFVTIAKQIVEEVLDAADVVVAPADTASIGSAGSTSASRQTFMSGGAVKGAAEAVRARLEAGESGVVEETYEHHHAPTSPLDENGQGNAHVAFTFVAHRAVVEVDVELGLVRVVEIATSQDVGKVLNPLAVVGQIEGGIAQGIGLATMEELLVRDGRVLNPTFTDYLIPTALDMPPVKVIALIEEPEPGAPFGAKGVGEAPTISSSAAVAAAIRAAISRPIERLPVRPEDIVERLVGTT